MDRRVTQATLIPIGGACIIGLAIMQHIRWMDGQFSELRSEIRELQRELNEQWTVKDMEIYALRFQNANPAVVVPDVRGVTESRKKGGNS